jgi:LmbE family N-acetylglucosaminyl deacetylase/2-polyprenyl-3-methyl-5-hydroxy-6-metoxy-1,4-benzoquinol methylase
VTVASAGVPFHHADPGTPESAWLGTDRWDGVGVLDLAALVRSHPDVLVVSAHPDDETLGVGGLVADLSDAGARVELLVATDGERSHPGLDRPGRSALARRRRAELEQAVQRLTPTVRTTYLALPDGGLERHRDTLVDEVRRRLGPGTLVLAPWWADGPADHDALGEACAEAVGAGPGHLVHYPVWLWHWGTPDALPWEDVVVAEPSVSSLWRKRAALAEFVSQTTAWTGVDAAGPAAAPVLGAAVLQRARRLFETLLDPHHVLPVLSAGSVRTRSVARAESFDRMYDAGSDPWGFAGSFYEDRRRSLVLAALGSGRHRRALELGCADGRLTEALLERCDEVVALDSSAAAVAAARERAPGATVVHGSAPEDLPAGPFDLVLVSEVGYFLRPLELVSTLRRVQDALAPDGEIVLCHWQHPTQEVPLDGVLVHEQAASMLRTPHRAAYVDADVRIEVWGDGPSPARREGRV